MDPKTKLDTAIQKKESGDQAFKIGEIPAALRSYHESLMYLQGLDKNALASLGIKAPAPPPVSKEGENTAEEEKKEKTVVEEMLEKIYSNMAACHMKKKNWQRAIECADKALAKNPENLKALFRKAKAFGEQGFFEKSLRVFEELKKKNPSDATNIDAEIAYYRKIDQEKEKASAKKMKGFLKNKIIESPTAPAEVKS